MYICLGRKANPRGDVMILVYLEESFQRNSCGMSFDNFRITVNGHVFTREFLLFGASFCLNCQYIFSREYFSLVCCGYLAVWNKFRLRLHRRDSFLICEEKKNHTHTHVLRDNVFIYFKPPHDYLSIQVTYIFLNSIFIIIYKITFIIEIFLSKYSFFYLH